MPQKPDLDRTNLEQALLDFEVPGLALAVVKDDEVVFAQGYGVRKLGEAVAVDEQTLFATGSISKSFTALCLAMLVDERKIGWDDPVTNYLPGFQLYDPYATRELTIRDLLSHRVGLAPVSGGTLWYGSTYDRAEVLRRARHLKPVSSFRSRFAYQNITYLAAGEIIPAASGMSWDDFVHERIFKPLQMNASNTSITALEETGNVATPHAKIDGSVQIIPYRDYDNVGPAASINSNVVDMAQYLRLYLASGKYGEQQLLSTAGVQELWAAQTVIPIEPLPAPIASLTPIFYSYGLGWFMRDYRGRKLIFHSGGVDGMTALAAMIPEERLGIVVLANQQEPIVGPVVYHILDSYLQLPPSDWFSAYLERRKDWNDRRKQAEATVEDARVGGTKSSLPLDHYVGTYHDVMYGDITIGLESGNLVLRFSQTPAFTADLEHWHYDTFRINWRDPMVMKGLVTFPLTSQGKIHELRLDQPKLLDVDFDELNFTRIPDNTAPAPQGT